MQDILTYFLHALAPSNLLVILTGTVVGIIVGALPGFTATMGIAILIPLTYTWNASTALIFLGAIYCGSMYGGSISAILINTPGTAAAAATAMDGYAMTRHGRLTRPSPRRPWPPSGVARPVPSPCCSSPP